MVHFLKIMVGPRKILAIKPSYKRPSVRLYGNNNNNQEAQITSGRGSLTPQVNSNFFYSMKLTEKNLETNSQGTSLINSEGCIIESNNNLNDGEINKHEHKESLLEIV